MQEAGDFRLVDFKCAGGLSLREPPGTNRVRNSDCQISLREAFFRVGPTDIDKNVAAAFFDLNSLAYVS